MKKKLVSLLLAGSVVASMAAVATVSASAEIDSNGCYTPGANVECGTYRYYFALPNTWLSEFSDTAGAYWYNGTDACGAVDGSGGSLKWPGYKAQRDEYKSDSYGVYFVDCPTDVPQIIWNNYVDGGEDKEAPIYLTAKQTNDAPTEFYAAEDSDLYDQDWFDEMEESFNGDKSKLGEFADNFFYDEVYDCGFVLNFDNMIFVAPAKPNGENFQGKPTYNGDWYFYYGEGEYGTYPTKEQAEEMGTLKNLNEVEEPTEPEEDPTAPEEDPTAPVEDPTVPVEDPTVPVEDPTDITDNTNPTENTNPSESEEIDDPSEDAPSSTKPASTVDSAATPDSGAIQTGEAAYAVILLVVLAAFSGAVVFVRKRYN